MRWTIVCMMAAAALFPRQARADADDPPADYYLTATATDASLRGQLKMIIDGVNDDSIAVEWFHDSISYDDLREELQITDADPGNPNHIILAYSRESLDVSGINPGGPIPGWNGSTWNREHTWPQSRGLNGDGQPDGSDLHHMRPTRNQVNSDRGELNFGGDFGSRPGGQLFGVLTDPSQDSGNFWYPGDTDAGMVARSSFYMDVRYDGADSNTQNLALDNGNVPNPSGANDPPPQMGNLYRLLEWHFASLPDSFERHRNQIIFDTYQHNRNPFIDRPEFAWAVFGDGGNDSQITIAGNGDGATVNVDLGRVYVGGALPDSDDFMLNKSGLDGTYFEVTTSGAATSSIAGRYNAFRHNQTDSKLITVGLNTSTATSGLKSGTVTINNLDITDGGAGRGANDANDVFDLSYAVLDHPVASLSASADVREAVVDFGVVPYGSGIHIEPASIYNWLTGGPSYAANLDLDSIHGTGDTGLLQLDLTPFAGLTQGNSAGFQSLFSATEIGEFAADFTLNLSGDDLPGEQMQTLSLSLVGEVILLGDYNRDNRVDAGDYVAWRNSLGLPVDEYDGADGNGDTMIDEADYQVWKDHYGDVYPGPGGGGLSPFAVPEPGGLLLLVLGIAIIGPGTRR